MKFSLKLLCWYMPLIPTIEKDLEVEVILRYMARLTSMRYMAQLFLTFSKFKVQNIQAKWPTPNRLLRNAEAKNLWLDKSWILSENSIILPDNIVLTIPDDVLLTHLISHLTKHTLFPFCPSFISSFLHSSHSLFNSQEGRRCQKEKRLKVRVAWKHSDPISLENRCKSRSIDLSRKVFFRLQLRHTMFRNLHCQLSFRT